MMGYVREPAQQRGEVRGERELEGEMFSFKTRKASPLLKIQKNLIYSLSTGSREIVETLVT